MEPEQCNHVNAELRTSLEDQSSKIQTFSITAIWGKMLQADDSPPLRPSVDQMQNQLEKRQKELTAISHQISEMQKKKADTRSKSQQDAVTAGLQTQAWESSIRTSSADTVPAHAENRKAASLSLR